jgi:uncharacterized protein (TIGR00299 family) protein
MHLHLHSTSGISGDMLVGGFLDLGLPLAFLQEHLEKLNLEGWEISQKSVEKLEVPAIKFDVAYEEKNHHRHLTDILVILAKSKLSPKVRSIAEDLFQSLGRAESSVHQVPIEEVHFHEVGAVDTIIDIISIAIALEYFEIESVSSSTIVEGVGKVRFSHGECDLPVPAVRELLGDIPLRRIPVSSELVTPTGAVFIQRFVECFSDISPLLQTRKGVGCGSKDLPHPNVLELQLSEQKLSAEEIIKLETNVDDLSPQHLASCIEKSLISGALDAWATPVFGKKGRIGQQLVLLCLEKDRDLLLEILLKESGSFGVRVQPVRRLKLDSRHENFSTEWGNISMRSGFLGKECWQWKPEHRDIISAAERTGQPPLLIEAQIRQAWGARLLASGEQE